LSSMAYSKVAGLFFRYTGLSRVLPVAMDDLIFNV
jgi:hypothetical protein